MRTREQGPKGRKGLITCHVLRTLSFFFRRKEKERRLVQRLSTSCQESYIWSAARHFLSFFFVLFVPPFLIIFFLYLSFYLISLFSFVLLEKEQRESLTFSAKRERLCYMHRKVRTILCYFFVLFFVSSPYGPLIISGTRSVYLDLIGKRMT